MTLNQLEYFCAVCRYHSIRRASDELFVSQPTISVAIRDLENEFHARFFHHGGNRLTLTPAGEAFYKKAEQLLADAQDIYARFSERPAARKPLRIGIPPILSTIFFPKLLQDFRKVEDIPIILFEHGSIRASELVESEELDAAVVNLDFYDLERFNYAVIMEDEYVFCVSRKHPLASEESVTFDMIKDEPLILFRNDSVQNRTINMRFEAHESTPNVILQSSQLYTIEQFVREEKAGAFLYSSISVDDELVCLRIEPAITSRIGVVWKKKAFIGTRLAAFTDFAAKWRL